MLAKKIDDASHAIRLIIKQGLQLTHGLKKCPEKEEAVSLLKETLALSGLSAPAVEKLKSLLWALGKSHPDQQQHGTVALPTLTESEIRIRKSQVRTGSTQLTLSCRHCQTLYRTRISVSRPRAGRQYWADESCGTLPISERL